MDIKDKTIQDLKREVARWKNRTLEAAYECCDRCGAKLSTELNPCEKCRIMRIREEASK